MKLTEFLYTEPDLYLLNGKHKDNIIATSLAEKLKGILLNNGPNISIRIDAVKHEPHLDNMEPLLGSNRHGLVSCKIDDKSMLLRLEDALTILYRDWHDYKITYEVNEEELE